PHDSAHFELPCADGRRMALAVDDAAELALRQGGRRESALPELGHDHRPDLVVLVLAPVEFGVPPADELLDRFAEIRRHVGDDPDYSRLRQARGALEIAREILRERIRRFSGATGTGHASFLPAGGGSGKNLARCRAETALIWRGQGRVGIWTAPAC